MSCRRKSLQLTWKEIRSQNHKLLLYWLSKQYRFYCPNHITQIVEIGTDKFLQNGSDSGSIASQMVVFEEQRVDLPLPSIVKGFEFSHNLVLHDEMKSPLNQPLIEEIIIIENTYQGNLGTLRQSKKI